MAIFKRLSVAAVLSAAAIGAMAQSNLKAITKSLENENNANVTYFEKRNPQTKKLTRTSLIVEVPDSKVNAVKNAFEKDRENAISYNKTGSILLYATFTEGNANTTYSIVTNAKNPDLPIQARPYAPMNIDANNILICTVVYSEK